MSKDFNFINPYNFIPLAKKYKPIRGTKEEGNLTGYIECSLETLTPLVMIDTESELKNRDHSIYDATYNINGVPAIPGSELRGMIRSKFETLTNSCYSSSEKELDFIGRYQGQDMFLPGILDLSEKGNPVLYKCQAFDGDSCEDLKRYSTGDYVKFNTAKNTNLRSKKEMVTRVASVKASGKYKYEGYVKKGELIQRKNHYHIFIMKKPVTGLANQNRLEEIYERVVELYHDNPAVAKDYVHPSETKGNLKPVWFQVDKYGFAYISLGENGQTVYRNQYKDIVNEEFLPCTDENNLCEACQMFGTVQDGVARNGKVRVSDALIEKGQTWKFNPESITLEELSQPKYSNAYFYMTLLDKNTNRINFSPGFSWTSDFRSKYKGNKSELRPFGTDEFEISINGRKEYWHFHPVIKRNVEQTKRNKTVKPVKEGVHYNFKVYFNNISSKQLEKLQLSISLQNDSSFAHKIGAGKPLGFGSVKVKTNKIVLRSVKLVDGEIEYKTEEMPIQEKELFSVFNNLDSQQKKAISHMYDFGFIEKDSLVQYPKNDKNSKGYEWFVSNNTQKGSKNKQTLPFAQNEYDKIIQQGFEPKVKNAYKNNNRRR